VHDRFEVERCGNAWFEVGHGAGRRFLHVKIVDIRRLNAVSVS
jgi:hypothetical protein